MRGNEQVYFISIIAISVKMPKLTLFSKSRVWKTFKKMLIHTGHHINTHYRMEMLSNVTHGATLF